MLEAVRQSKPFTISSTIGDSESIRYSNLHIDCENDGKVKNQIEKF